MNLPTLSTAAHHTRDESQKQQSTALAHCVQQLPVHGAAGQDELTHHTKLNREIEMSVAIQPLNGYFLEHSRSKDRFQ